MIRHCFYFLLTFLLVSTSSVVAQTASYVYDSAGNCVERSILIGNKSAALSNQDNYFLEETLLESTFKIYPNPTKGILKVDFGFIAEDKTVTIEVYDMNGSRVYYHQLKGESFHIVDLTPNPKGVYVMTIMIASDVTTWRIVKEG